MNPIPMLVGLVPAAVIVVILARRPARWARQADKVARRYDIALTPDAWWSAVRAIMQRPARAGDVVELGWDDVFRYRHARGLTIAAAWAPAAVAVLLLDSSLEPDAVDFIPIYGMIAAGVALNQLFQRGDPQWRKFWS